jgi:hypothetical protein
MSARKCVSQVIPFRQMSRVQIVGEILIGLFLLIVGAVFGPLFKRLWQWFNRPSPLTPQTRGELTTQLAISEGALSRFNYLGSNQKDLFLYLIQLIFFVLFCSIFAVMLYISPQLTPGDPYIRLHLVAFYIFLILADLVCLLGMIEASKMSDKRLDGEKARVQKRIDDIKKLLNPPTP